MTVAMIDTVINGRWTVKLPEHRALRPEWTPWVDAQGREHGGWESERLASMYRHLTTLTEIRRPVIVDVGTEEGDLTALYSLWGCDVIMVEPNPRVWPNIRAIWNANRLVEPVMWWVGFASDAEDLTQTEWFEEHVFGPQMVDDECAWPKCAYGEVIGDHAFLHLAQHPHVPTITLDGLTEDVCKVDAITMDVEGSELAVLRGAERILRDERPLVWVSVHTDEQWMDENYPKASRVEIVTFMGELGYQGTHLATDHEEHWMFTPIEAL